MSRKWEVLKDELAQMCAELGPGGVLPSTQELIAQGRGSRTTVGNAYRELIRLGFVKGVPGTGYIVRDRRVVVIPLSRYGHAGADGLGPWETATRAQGMNGTMTLIEVTTAEATVSVAERLGLTAETHHQVTRRTRHALINETEVLQIQSALYPVEVARRCGLDRRVKIEGGTLPALAAEYRLGRATERISFQSATDAEVRTLKLAQGSSVARVERLLIAEDGTPLELLQVAAAPDRVEFVYDDLDLQRMV
ncbi:GntR family transcriptional regulator [Kitasatospora sp. NPDC002965]|uniref:GntR family transcriptional regulator n=1 Tax=Kitasatospora sp. NPDC002965 TaxID=3154775 RepID=UPI0033B5AE52